MDCTDKAASASTHVVDELIERHRDRKDLHITRVLGVLIAVSEGRVIDTDSRDALRSCPLQKWFSDSDPKTYIQEKIAQFGHFTCCREITRGSVAVPYGTSEMLMYALRRGTIDCAVTVSDGAGSVVSGNPEVVQGIGARMNGLFYTTAIPEVVARYREAGCLVFDDGRIDQARAVRAAVERGHRRIGVTVNGYYGESYRALRSLERELGIDLVLAAVCTTGVSRERAEEITRYADIAWSCASRYVRELGRSSRLQLTQAIPVFAYTAAGIRLISAYSDDQGAAVLRALDSGKQYLLSSTPAERMIRLGEGRVGLHETSLPAGGRQTPEPLR